MRISLSNNYKSIPAFDSIYLPEFTIIVGLNGTGKSQLLEAIKSHKVDCDALVHESSGAQNQANSKVVMLTNTSLNLNSEMYVERNLERDGLLKYRFEKNYDEAIEKVDLLIKNSFRNTEYRDLSTKEIIKKPREEFIRALESSDLDEMTKHSAKTSLDSFNDSLCRHSRIIDLREIQSRIDRVARHSGVEARLLSFEDVTRFGTWGNQSMFHSELPKLFHGYRHEYIENNKKSARETRTSKSDWLNDIEFQDRFGIPPWEKISSIMKDFDLNYRIAPPGPREIDPVVLYFERLDEEGKHVEFSSLSAGEKVLVLLSIALLDIAPSRALLHKTPLLLLDEIDASLHPAVLHQWIMTIRDKVVGKMGIPCIMTTHSPVTVALAPEESLFEMRRENIPLSKISMREALNKLTVGLPSMEVDFTQRRQIFVEADVDAQAYDRLHSLMKAELQLPRSLNFLSTGIKNKQGVEQGTGCDAVKKIVSELAGFGSLSTFGLLDWDGTRTPSDRIHVLAQGTHYAFDNVILHPLLIGLLLIRNSKPPAEGLPPFVGIDRLEYDGLQRIADAVQSQLTYPDGASKKKIPVQFINDITIMTDEVFCQSNGHKMEETLVAAFPYLQKFTQKRGKLALNVIDQVLGDCPDFCPKPLAEAFRTLSEAEP